MKKATLGLLLLASSALAAPLEDRVYSLTGWNGGSPFPFQMYSGFIPVLGSTKNLHYMYIDSQRDPTNDPLILWFNGGPGCSSMLGFLQEHGPYIMDNGGTTFHKNEYSWNKEANMLYIEAPAGVGFSYCLDQRECVYNDNNQAFDNLYALIYWYEEKFPERKNNDLYLSGESYAGIYVPTLAYRIDQHNLEWATDPTVFKPKLKGFFVGNAVTNWRFDTTNAYIEMGMWYGLLDTDTYEQLYANDCPRQMEYFEFKADNMTEICKTLCSRFFELTKDINVYDVFGECYRPTGEEAFDTVEGPDGEVRTYKKFATALDYTPWLKRTNPLLYHRLKELPPCTFGVPIIKFLN